MSRQFNLKPFKFILKSVFKLTLLKSKIQIKDKRKYEFKHGSKFNWRLFSHGLQFNND